MIKLIKGVHNDCIIFRSDNFDEITYRYKGEQLPTYKTGQTQPKDDISILTGKEGSDSGSIVFNMAHKKEFLRGCAD